MNTIAATAGDAIASVEQSLIGLEAFALKHRVKSSKLPPLAAPRNFRNVRALYNAVDATLVSIENIAATLPRNVSYGRSHIQAKLIDYNAGERFLKKMSEPAKRLKETAVDISRLKNEFGPTAAIILEQTNLFETSIKAQAAIITRASKMAKPADPKTLKKECEPLIDASSEVADLKYEADVRSGLYVHAMALGDASAALGWIVAPAPLKHVREYKHIVMNLSSNILASYIDLGCNPMHSNFAEALNKMMEVLVEYVESEHPAGLRWNYAQGATPLGYRRAQRNLRKDSHPIGDFYRIMHGALTEFVLLSRQLGGPLKKVSDYTLGAYEELGKAIETASGRVRPQGSQSGELKMLLVAVQNELTPVIDTLDAAVKADDKFSLHCLALREFINSLQWCSATMQKMSPVGYVIDIEKVTLLYLKKVEEEHAKGDRYVHRLHQAWVDSVRNMLNEMKDYVKNHHPNELMFDTQRTRKSVDALIQSVSLANQLKALKVKSTATHWKKKPQPRMTVKGIRKTVLMWVKDK